jgi:hypothetical protein
VLLATREDSPKVDIRNAEYPIFGPREAGSEVEYKDSKIGGLVQEQSSP